MVEAEDSRGRLNTGFATCESTLGLDDDGFPSALKQERAELESASSCVTGCQNETTVFWSSRKEAVLSKEKIPLSSDHEVPYVGDSGWSSLAVAGDLPSHLKAQEDDIQYTKRKCSKAM